MPVFSLLRYLSFHLKIQPGALDDDFGSSGSEESELESDEDEGEQGVKKRRGEQLLSDDDDDESGSEDDDDDDDEEEEASSSDSEEEDEGTHANDASFAALERKSAKLDARRARDSKDAAQEAKEQGLPSGADDERVALLPVVEEGEGEDRSQPDEPRVLRRRIAEVARVLESFSKLAEKGRSRSDYMERVRGEFFWTFFSFSSFFSSFFFPSLPLRSLTSTLDRKKKKSPPF